ncbi:hypothetical protein S245_039416, partial [Arachis hypogaea]
MEQAPEVKNSKVVLTSRDEKRGLHALETLKHLSHLVLFHHLHVAVPASVDSLANFIKSEFRKGIQDEL